MWEILGAFVARPSYLIIAALLAFSGWQYVLVQKGQSDLIKSEAAIVEMKTELEVCTKNTNTVVDGIDKCNQATKDLKKNNELLVKKLEEEKKRVAYWKKMYSEKKCFGNDDEVVKPNTTGAVLNDGKSNEAVQTINSMYLRFNGK